MTVYPNAAPRTLSAAHRRMLFEESGISPDVAAQRGYYTARRRSEVPGVFKGYQRRPGLVVPMFSPDGETVGYQLRPDRTRKGGPKYETPSGASPVVDVHPRMLEEVRHGSRPLLITEGAKTGDAATSRGVPTVVLAGVWMWCIPKVRPYRLKPCFDHVRLKGREVVVAFDSDCMSKVGVQDALAALVGALEARGAAVKVVYLEDAPDGSKRGVDDYLAAGGSVKEMLMLARKFEPADVGRIRLSRDDRLRLAVEDLERRFWAEEWRGMGGHSDRDIALKLMEAAARHGENHPDGIRVVKAWGPLGVEAKVSSRTLAKAIVRLEERGFCYRDNEGREAGKPGAFVLRATPRAGVKHYGGSGADGGQATTPLQGCDHGTLHLRAPRLRWSSPKFTPRRGTVRGTRKVRESKPPTPRPAVARLGKIRGAVLDVLDANGGALHINELADALHRRRARDLRRRNLPMLEEAGIIGVDGDTVSLADDWLDRLEEQRELGGEGQAERLARARYERKRRAYHGRHETAPDHHYANVGADGWIEDLELADAPEPVLSPLAAAMKAYLERNPGDRNQPPGWLGLTLWAHDFCDGKPTPEESRAALEELRPKRRSAA